VTPLPSWIDQEAFDDYQSMRSRIKKPMSSRRLKQFMARLQELHDKGHDVNACLDAATDHQWLDVYPLRQEAIPNLRTAADESAERLRLEDEHRRASQSPEAHRARQMALAALKVVR
jgi:hypothetical protein